MSEHKGPRPVAWEGWHATITGERPRGALPGFVDVQEYEANEPGRDYSMTPDEAEAHAHALIMAAAVARGEHGHTAALNRVAVALGAPFNRLTNPSPGDLRVLCDEWADMAQRIAGMVEAHLGVPLPRSLPPAVRTVVAERDAAREALAAACEALGVVGNGSPVLAAWSLRHECAALRDDLAAAGAAVAPLRDALGGVLGQRPGGDPGRIIRMACALLNSAEWPADDGRHGAKPTREPMTHTSLASIEVHGVVVGDRLECVAGKTPHDPLSGFAVEAIRMRAALALLGVLVRDAAGRRQSPAFDDLAWPLTVVEAPDAD